MVNDDAIATCRLCHGRGTVSVGPRINDAHICPCVALKRRRRIARRIIQERLGPDAAAMRLTTYQTGGLPANEHALQVAKAFVDKYQRAEQKGWHVVFWGPPGCGKTHLTTGIAVDAAYRWGAKPVIWNIPRELRRERARFGGDGPKTSPIDEAIRADLLVLDDLGAEYHRAGADADAVTWTYEVLYTILDARVMDGKPSLFTTNCTPDELRNRMSSEGGKRVLSRVERRLVTTVEVQPVPGAGNPNAGDEALLLDELGL